MSATLVGLKPDRPKIPVVPLSITGPCIYGHILTDQHIRHFKELHSDIDIKEDDPECLVSIASILTLGGCHTAHGAYVFDGGQKLGCLIQVDNRIRTRYLDMRRGNDFRIAIEKEFGIEGEPQWYPAYRPPCTTLLDTSSKTCTPTASEGMTTLFDTSRYSMSATLVGLEPDRPKIPVVPLSITGPCIYGHIITDQHIRHFKDLHSDIDIKEDNPECLVSIASILTLGGLHTARSAYVFDGDQKRGCLIQVDNRIRTRYLDLRCDNDFRIAIEKEFGIEGEPQWYPTYRPPCTTLLDTSHPKG